MKSGEHVLWDVALERVRREATPVPLMVSMEAMVRGFAAMAEVYRRTAEQLAAALTRAFGGEPRH